MSQQKSKLIDPEIDDLPFDKLMARFVFEEPFYAFISRQIKKSECKKIPTAGVWLENGSFNMKYNPEFIKTLYASQFFEVMKHEIMHIVFGHCTNRPLTKDPDMHYLANIAQDLAINSLLNATFLPKFCVMPGKLYILTEEEKKRFTEQELAIIIGYNKLIASFPLEKTSEWYWERLHKNSFAKSLCDMRKKNKLKIKVVGPNEEGMSKEEIFDKIMGKLDEHEGFGNDMSKEDRDILKEDVRDMIEKAIEEADSTSDGWGNIPAHMQKKLRKLASRQVNWKAILKTFVGMAKSVHHTTTMKRINRRYPYIHAGVKRRRTARIAIAVDQSGSVHDKEIRLFFAELESLAKWVDFEVIPFDSQVNEDEIFTWKRGQKLEPKRVSCGGTDFDVPTKFVNERTDRYDAMIIFTDGECFKPITCKVKRLYLLPPDRKLAFETNEMVIEMNNVKD